MDDRELFEHFNEIKSKLDQIIFALDLVENEVDSNEQERDRLRIKEKGKLG